MKRIVLVGAAFASGALLAACGSTAHTTAPSTAKAPVTKTPTKTAKASPVTYASVYAGISSAPLASDGYPFSVPDNIRVLSPTSLKQAIEDTSSADVGDVYVGAGLTATQRMEQQTVGVFLFDIDYT